MKMEKCCGNCYWNMITKLGIMCLHKESDLCGDIVTAENICHLYDEWPASTEEVGRYAEQQTNTISADH